jgi:pyruvate formate lyase activating enzyme
VISECKICGEKKEVSQSLKICVDCIRTDFDQAFPFIEKAHKDVKREFGMPETPPRTGIPCGFCINECKIEEGETGYCGSRRNKDGIIIPKSGSDDAAFVECYYDPLPTNCVSMKFCGEKNTRGKKNLAVFYGSCTYDCLFCQNWHYRTVHHVMSVDDLASWADDNTACICYFGGDPTPQIMHALNVAEKVNTRICWETNGAFSRGLARKIGKTAFASGGTIKIDLKTYSENLNYALCGSSNKNTLANFKYIYESFQRKDPPILVASTLLVPGYIDEKEVSHIAEFIGSIDPDIPYCLLAFHPHFKMQDLPYTSRDLAHSCLKAAQKYLNYIDLGNVWLLR